MAERKYTLHFATTADLTAAGAAEASVKKIGDAATSSGNKLADFEAEMKARIDAVRAKLTEAQSSLTETMGNAGADGAAKFGAGFAVNLASSFDLIRQAQNIGQGIGDALGSAMVAAHEGSLEDAKDQWLASLGFWSAQAAVAARETSAAFKAAMDSVNGEISEKTRTFWADYNNSLPRNAGDWLDEIGTSADTAKAKLQSLSEVQTALLKLGKSQAEQDFLDEKARIANDPNLSERDRIAANAANEERKAQAEASIRQQERVQKAGAIGAGVRDKSSEVDQLRAAELEQQRRAQAYQQAKALADAEIAAREAGGSALNDKQKADTTRAIFDRVGQNTGVSLDISQDENAELLRIKAERQKAELELNQLRLDAANKAKVLALEEVAESDAIARTQKRNREETQRRMDEAQQREWAQQEEAAKAKAARDDKTFEENSPWTPPPLTTPGGTSDPTLGLSDLLSKGAQTTNDSALKMDLEAMKRALSDGTSREEMKQIAALAERMAVGNNEALGQVAKAMRSALESAAASMAALKGEIAALQSTAESLRLRNP